MNKWWIQHEFDANYNPCCAQCGDSLRLLQDHEWPDDTSLILCTSCYIEVLGNMIQSVEQLEAEIVKLRAERNALRDELQQELAERIKLAKVVNQLERKLEVRYD